MNDIYDKIQSGFYDLTAEYPGSKPAKPKLKLKHSAEDIMQYAEDFKIWEKKAADYSDKLTAFRKSRNLSENKFRDDALIYADLFGHALANRCWNMALEYSDDNRTSRLETLLDFAYLVHGARKIAEEKAKETMAPPAT